MPECASATLRLNNHGILLMPATIELRSGIPQPHGGRDALLEAEPLRKPVRASRSEVRELARGRCRSVRAARARRAAECARTTSPWSRKSCAPSSRSGTLAGSVPGRDASDKPEVADTGSVRMRGRCDATRSAFSALRPIRCSSSRTFPASGRRAARLARRRRGARSAGRAAQRFSSRKKPASSSTSRARSRSGGTTSG